MSNASKTETELTPKDVHALHVYLLEERERFLTAYREHVHAGQEMQPDMTDDSLDRAAMEHDREMMFEMSTAEREQLLEIEDALRRVEDGTFGICEYSNRPIPLRRLNAVPWARYRTGYQELAEQGLLAELD